MNILIDPVWPWAWFFDVLRRLPSPIPAVVAMAAVLAGVLTVFVLRRASRRTVGTVGATLLGALVLSARHTLPMFWTSITEFSSAIALQLAFWGLLLTPGVVLGIGVGTYLGTQGLTRRGLALMIGLRTLAFVLTFIALIRPSLGYEDREQTQSVLMVAVDSSPSMTVADEQNKKSRWENLLASLKAARPALDRLREDHQIDVRFYRFADELSPFDPDAPGEPGGSRTELGAALRSLTDQRPKDRPFRGLCVLSDGGDNGALPSLGEASRLRNSGGILHSFACGNPSTRPNQRDVAITAISTAPTPTVPVKGKLTVKLTIDARGYENANARVKLFLEAADEKGEIKDREVLSQAAVLALTTGNEVTLVADAPAVPGDVKVKAVVEWPDDFPANNVIETFVTVSKEGISVLLVDRQRAFEPQRIIDAVADPARIRVTPVWVRGGKPVGGASLADVFGQPYDVVILGDVTVEQLRALDAQAPEKIEKMVSRGAGLLVIGGYTNLANGDWKGSPLESMLPIDLGAPGQVDKPTRMMPTEDGTRRVPYVLRLDDVAKVNAAWEKLSRLEGYTTLKIADARRGLAQVLATSDDMEKTPLLVYMPYAGKAAEKKDAVARVMVFAGDTTWRWVRNEETQAMHGRFWRQMVVWLARQEDADGNVWIVPESRRIPARSEMRFAGGARSKGGAPITEGTFDATLTAPDGTSSKVDLQRSPTEIRGGTTNTKAPGVYRIALKGSAVDPAGGKVEGTASARVIVYDEDVEMSRPAADPEFLKKLATAGGGEAFRVEQFAEFLERLAEAPADSARRKVELRPDWRTTGRSGFLVGFFVVFCAVVIAEWALRRWWGMV